jgi:hypothetical protein
MEESELTEAFIWHKKYVVIIRTDVVVDHRIAADKVEGG